MEKYRLKIKLKTSTVRNSSHSASDNNGVGISLEGTAATEPKSSSEAGFSSENREDMKRKRGPRAGYKKGKKKQPLVVNDPAPAPVCINVEDTVDLDDSDDDQVSTKMNTESPSCGLDKVSNKSNTDADIPNDMSTGKSGHGRVKVKLRSSRVLEAQRTYSDAQTQSDTDMSNPQVVLQIHDSILEKREDSTYSDGQTSDLQTTVSGKSPRKAGSIKIISSRALGSSSSAMLDKHLKKPSSPLQMLGERGSILSDNEKAIDSSVSMKLRLRDTKLPYRDPCYNEKELSTALAVIKKIMKMDAAEPFNAPVNPVALGIPDYFDIIETPMDFGTIRSDLECGRKYLNSEDVYKDVQFIWENCYRYNNKGDYIIDLMKRVKKNFMKYWMAAGLYCDIPTNGANESTQVENIARSGQEKLHPKVKFSKHKRRRHGIHQHKSGCLCAVCVVRRRRKEREENSAMIDGEMATSDGNLLEEFKQEESSPIDNACSDPTSSSLDHSPEPDANVDVEEPEHEVSMETPEQPETVQLEKQEMSENDMELQTISDGNRTSQLLFTENGNQEDSNQPSQGQETELGFLMEQDDVKGVMQQPEEAEIQHPEETQNKQEESFEMDQQISIFEDPLHHENHSILQICRALFPNNPRSVWSGPHSLDHRRGVSVVREGPIHTAVALFLKQ